VQGAVAGVATAAIKFLGPPRLPEGWMHRPVEARRILCAAEGKGSLAGHAALNRLDLAPGPPRAQRLVDLLLERALGLPHHGRC
jgi:hypothetical protein